ncbi:hypothetical protein A2W57_00890 [Candidatus Giovannonibacteria bacterium RIFCSPHIGHO2_02_43_16]|nr:MAG: hypothetical protein A2W57_00890 [Candidatus Giovannonibacteria bacterium RIFCSPHIGHO2_02_43_16]
MNKKWTTVEMPLSEDRKGEIYIFLSSVAWSFFPVITVLSYRTLPGLVSLGWSTFFATVFFAVLVGIRKKWKELINPVLWKYIFFIALFIGVLYYLFLFLGLEKTTPGNAAIIALFEICTSYTFFSLYRRERMSFEHTLGVVFMLLGALIVLVKDFSGFNLGDVFVLLATFFPPIGNLFQQKARLIASSESIMFLRSAVSIPIVFMLAYLFNEHATRSDVRISLAYLLINGVLLLGLSKILWIESIHRISVTKANALSSISPLLTLLIAWALLSQVPTVWQLASLAPFIFGVLLLTDNVRLKETKAYVTRNT